MSVSPAGQCIAGLFRAVRRHRMRRNNKATTEHFSTRLAHLQRRMSRKEKLSKNWQKAKAKVVTLHSKTANIRKDFRTQGLCGHQQKPRRCLCKCPECGHTAAENREMQAKFACIKCGFPANADWVGAFNIKEAGLALLAWSQSSGDVSSSCQEPTEATQVQRCA